MTGAKDYVDALRLTPEQVRELLGDAAPSEPRPPESERRAEPRHSYEGSPIVLIEIRDPGQRLGTYRAISCNISENGICFLHGMFVYPGSVCKVILLGTRTGITTAHGHVVRCRHLRGRIHEVGMRFDEPLDLSQINLGPKDQGADGAAA